MPTSDGLWSAAVAAATALAVFVLTQWVTGRRERRGRAYERRRAALVDAQDAALALRDRLGAFGPLARRASGAPPDAELVAAQYRADEAFARLEVCVTRIEDAAVVAGIAAWRDLARFHYISAEDVTTTEELAAWRRMNDVIGAALVSGPGRA